MSSDPLLEATHPSFDALLKLGHEAERLGDRAQARDWWDRALTGVRTADDAARVAELAAWVARAHALDGDTDAALDCLEVTAAIAELAGDDRTVAVALHGRATALLAGGDSEQATRLLGEARLIGIRAGEPRIAVGASHQLGAIASRDGDLETARRHFEATLHMSRGAGIRASQFHALVSLAGVRTGQAAWEAADEALAAAAALLRNADTPVYQAHLDVARAETALARREETAPLREKVARALESARRGGEPPIVTEALRVAGLLELREHELDDAAAHLAESERIGRACALPDRLALVLQARAELALRTGDNAVALRRLLEARTLLRRAGSRPTSPTMTLAETAIEDCARRWSAAADRPGVDGRWPDVTALVDAVAARIGVPVAERLLWRLGASLRDVGMDIVAPEVRAKAVLNDDEWARVRRHPEWGLALIDGAVDDATVREMVVAHHERWDGGGYPRGIAGMAIPPAARLLAIVDAYCALRADRPYRTALSHEAALELLRRDVGVAFDPTLFAHFEDVVWNDAPDGGPAGDGNAGARDELTGLLRRGAFATAAEGRLTEARAAGQEASLLLIDLDHLGLVNEAFGLPQGDDVLRVAADAMRAVETALDGAALLGRYAGDELVALLPGRAHPAACAVAESLRAAVAASASPRRDDPASAVRITLSIGVATSPLHGVTLGELFGAAAAALRAAKRRGRDNVTAASLAATPTVAEPRLDAFVGRGAERRHLDRLLTSAARGTLEVTALVGEAGIGKSTLARRLGAAAGVRGGRLVVGATMEGNGRGPLAPWADVLRELYGRGGAPVPPRARAVLQRLVPSLAGGDAAPSAERLQQGAEPVEEIAAAVLAAATERPLVVVLEDVHHADAAVLDVVEVIARWHARERLLLCLTARTEELDAGAAERLARVAGDRLWQIERLGADELAEWLGIAFGGRLIGDELGGDVARWSAGNPGIASALLKTLARLDLVRFHQGAWQYAAPAELPLHPAITAPLSRRLARLTRDARRTLRVAAALGDGFDQVALAEAAAVEADRLFDALDQGGAAAVVRLAPRAGVTGGGRTRWTFAHPLLRELLLREPGVPLRRG